MDSQSTPSATATESLRPMSSNLQPPTTFHDLATTREADSTVASSVGVPSSQPRNPPRQHISPSATSGSSSTSATLHGEKTSDDHETTIVESGPIEGQFAAIKSAPTQQTRPSLRARGSSFATEDDLFKALSQRRTRDDEPHDAHEAGDEVKRLMSRMFGTARQQQSEDEHTRHAGVVFRNLTVKGVGLGASLQPTVGDLFLGLPRLVRSLFAQGPRAAFARPPIRDLLHDLNGCVRPGEMLLVLGRPGSGCSTFLKTFCNQRAGYADVQGEVTYGGMNAKRMARDFRGEVIYNPEDDLHYATLSVRRTLRFALQTRTPGKASRLEGESKQDYVQEFLRVATKLLWIEHTLGTKVGNEYVRGVSGGERKRVSIAEALVTRASVQGWDNSSKGLDAATAVEYVQALRALTNMAHVSTAVSLYQAGESLYQLVDKVLLIHEGQCLYYGSADHAKQYFMDLGFDCPKRWTTADFLTSLTDEHARSVKKGYEDRIPRSAEDFARVYRKSYAYQQNLEDMQAFEADLEQRKSQNQGNAEKKIAKKNYTIPFYEQVWACTQRQFFVMLGDRASLVGKWGGIVFQALIVGSTFFQLADTTAGVFPKGGVLFLILLFNALLALAEQTAAFESKPILLKHKNFSFYRPAAYALAQTVVDIPLVLIQVLLFSIVIYWMAGLAATASQFFIAIVTQWLVTMATYAFFRLIAALSKTIDDATKVTGVGIQVLIVYTGYLISPSQMRPWFAWLRFLNWIQYGFEMLMSNEFYNANMQCVPPSLVPQGPEARPQYQSCTLAGSTPGSTVVNGGAYIRAAFTYTRDHLWRNFGFLWLFFLFFLACTCLAMERMKPNAGGGAITTFKRGQIPKAVENNIQTGGRKGEDVERLGELPEKSAPSDASPEDANAVEKLAKNETVFTFQDVSYTIPYEGGERKLLQHVSGFVRPGRLTALMGASGAGKTTLLNTLAQRITFGTVTGEFLVDGRPLPLSFQRATGFAEQMDIHESTSTVREALQFSALLRQPREVSKEEKYAYCETIIDLLEMRDIAGATIGRIGEGLNQEQRKRLTIGVELASKPELLFFLDEPTSGLDSGAAFNIVRFLRKLADAGQAVLCTIHQPSAILFEQFDELLLLKSGGRVVYNGPLGRDSRDLRKYFAENGTGSKCPPEANPAEWMLDVIGAGNPDYNGPDYGDVWLESENHKRQLEEIQSLIEKRRNVEQSSSIRDDREYAMPLGVQIRAVVLRSYTSFWRNPNYFLGIFFLHILTGLFNCFTFYHIGFDTVSYQERLFTIFLTLTICPPLIQQLQPVFLQSRNIFQSRENNAKIYSWFAWTCGVVLVEIPYRLAAGAVYFCCWWWGTMGYRTSGFTSGFTFLVILLFELYYTSFGQAIASFSPNELLASLLVPLFFLFIVAFCGVIVPPQQLPTFWRSWMYWLTPFHYLLEALLAVAIHQQPVTCKFSEFARFSPPPNQSCQSYVGPYIARAGGYVQTSPTDSRLCEFCQYTVGDEYGRTFSVFYSNKWRDFGIFCAFILFNYFVIFACTWLRFRVNNPLASLRMKMKLQVKKARAKGSN